MSLRVQVNKRRWYRYLTASSATLIVGLLPVASAPMAAASSPMTAASAYRSSGSFTFGGAISGTLLVPRSQNYGGLPGCGINGIEGVPPHLGGDDIITWDNVKLRVGGKQEAVMFIDLTIGVPEFGRAYSMVPSPSSPHAGVSLTIPASYTAKTGTVTTSEGGKSGSLKGTLSSPGSHPGTVSIRGSWAGCAKVRT
jgi:hypothetical protein